jgi:hypothetical protein
MAKFTKAPRFSTDFPFGRGKGRNPKAVGSSGVHAAGHLGDGWEFRFARKPSDA